MSQIIFRSLTTTILRQWEFWHNNGLKVSSEKSSLLRTTCNSLQSTVIASWQLVLRDIKGKTIITACGSLWCFGRKSKKEGDYFSFHDQVLELLERGVNWTMVLQAEIKDVVVCMWHTWHAKILVLQLLLYAVDIWNCRLQTFLPLSLTIHIIIYTSHPIPFLSHHQGLLSASSYSHAEHLLQLMICSPRLPDLSITQSLLTLFLTNYARLRRVMNLFGKLF